MATRLWCRTRSRSCVVLFQRRIWFRYIFRSVYFYPSAHKEFLLFFCVTLNMQILFCCFVKLNRPCTLVHWLQLVRRNRRPKISTSDATFKSFQCQNFCGFSSSSFSWPDLRTLWRQTSFPCGRPEFFFFKKSQRTRQISFFFVGGNSSIESSADTRKFEHYNPPPPSPKKKEYVYYTHRAAVGCMQNVIMLILVYKLPSFRFFFY